eukprot:TRINITY_DN655_c0_g1_i1.p1 TRINITY_DN655_c0_g1~~TRINITY_DN655_c0_g1_i1.p1  ORF type:complete len:131 (+),score=12.44 TRINITY_DN655_c0_g1_i1:45-437(+)
MSSKCPTCLKTVYHAERVQAIGFDFHRRCLKCATCSKTLAPGNVSDRGGTPYCSQCYAGAAGIKGYGFGSTLDSHVSGGQSGTNNSPRTAATASNIQPSSNAPPAGANFCANCGTKAAGGNFCANCGNRL